jgi:hypothetical protein
VVAVILVVSVDDVVVSVVVAVVVGAAVSEGPGLKGARFALGLVESFGCSSAAGVVTVLLMVTVDVVRVVLIVTVDIVEEKLVVDEVLVNVLVDSVKLEVKLLAKEDCVLDDNGDVSSYK